MVQSSQRLRALFMPMTVQIRGSYGWADVSAAMFYLPTAEAMLKRWQEDAPDR